MTSIANILDVLPIEQLKTIYTRSSYSMPVLLDTKRGVISAIVTEHEIGNKTLDIYILQIMMQNLGFSMDERSRVVDSLAEEISVE